MPYSDAMPISNTPCEAAMIRTLAALLLERLKSTTPEAGDAE